MFAFVCNKGRDIATSHAQRRLITAACLLAISSGHAQTGVVAVEDVLDQAHEKPRLAAVESRPAIPSSAPLTPEEPTTSPGDQETGQEPTLVLIESPDIDIKKPMLEEIVVLGKTLPGPGVDITRSETRLNAEAIARVQGADVFESLNSIAGVNVEGGPRTSGKTISIRGFSDNEDVLVQIDGVSQNFEKYRYGSGVDIEPELLKSARVSRSGAGTTDGSGYIGGVVKLETKDAVDLLEPGQNFGASIKGGLQSNNDGSVISLSGYGIANDSFDTLLNVVRRESNNVTLHDGSQLSDSGEEQNSVLGKVTYNNARGDIGLTRRYAESSALEPFDVTGTDGFGQVRRDSVENSTSVEANLQPGIPYTDLHAQVGYIEKTVAEDDFTFFDDREDTFDFFSWNSTVENRNEFRLGEVSISARSGLQFTQETRRSLRTPESTGITEFNTNQPSGRKRTHAMFSEHTASVGGFTATMGLRRDWYAVSASDELEGILAAQNQPETVRFDETSPSFAFSYARGPATFFARRNRTFRAPLLDEYFGRGSQNGAARCGSFNQFLQPPVFPNSADFPPVVLPPTTSLVELFPGGPLIPITIPGITLPPAANPEFIAQLNEATAAQANYDANPEVTNVNAVCGNLYEPETSVTREIGLAMEFDGLLSPLDYLTGKLTYFTTRVDNLLESIYQDSITGEIRQPGIETRRGFEFELNYDSENWFGSFNLSTLSGEVEFRYFVNTTNNIVNEAVQATGLQAALQPQDIYNVPGDSINVTVGRRLNRWNLEFGNTVQASASRLVTAGTLDIDGCETSEGNFPNPSCFIFRDEPGYVTVGAFANWRPSEHVTVRATGTNLLNQRYRLSGFAGGPGAFAAGRDIRISVALNY